MPRLPVLSGTEVVRALEHAGFVVCRQTGSHVILRHPAKRLSIPVPMHGGRDLPTGTLRGIIRDADLTLEEFSRLLP